MGCVGSCTVVGLSVESLGKAVGEEEAQRQCVRVGRGQVDGEERGCRVGAWSRSMSTGVVFHSMSVGSGSRWEALGGEAERERCRGEGCLLMVVEDVGERLGLGVRVGPV